MMKITRFRYVDWKRCPDCLGVGEVATILPVRLRGGVLRIGGTKRCRRCRGKGQIGVPKTGRR